MGNPAFNGNLFVQVCCHSGPGERNKQDVLRINTFPQVYREKLLFLKLS